MKTPSAILSCFIKGRRPTRRRGSILIVALWCIVIMVAIVMVSVRSARVDGIAAAGRVSMMQANAIEHGAEQFVLAQLDGGFGDSAPTSPVTGSYPDAVPIGKGYFWILSPDPTDDQNYRFGIMDEAGKLNINTATPAQLQLLPNMDSTLAESMKDWRDADDETTNGAETTVYNTLANPYNAKNLPFESLEELRLVNGYSDDIMFGVDLNRNGVIESYEQQSDGSAVLSTGLSSTNDTRGIFNYLTAWSVEANTTVDGKDRTNVNDGLSAVQKAFTGVSTISSRRTGEITNRLAASYARPPGGGNGAAATTQIFTSIGAFYAASGMTSDEFRQVADLFTVTKDKTIVGKVNVNTAPLQVLVALGLQQTDAESLISAQIGQPSIGTISTTNVPTIAWVYETLGASKANKIAPFITARSFQYSADIVAVSGDGRAFKRVRIVVDTTYSPAKIVYRRDLTSLGWPLDPQIQTDLRAGQFERSTQGNTTR